MSSFSPGISACTDEQFLFCFSFRISTKGEVASNPIYSDIIACLDGG